MSKKLEDMDFAALEARIMANDRFTAPFGSLEISATGRRPSEPEMQELPDDGPRNPIERERWKARNYMKHYTGGYIPAAQRLVQAAAAEELMTRYTRYAVELGCRVVQDSILVDTPEQAAALDAWWKEQTK